MDSCDTERLIVHQDGSTATAATASITASGGGSGGGTASAMASTASTTSTRQQPSLLRLRRNTVPRGARHNLDEEAPPSFQENVNETIVTCPDSGNWNHSMTFDGQVFLSKNKKLKNTANGLLNGNWDYFLIGVQVLGLFLCIIALYFCYFHFQLFHYHVTGVYARLGHADAQHLLGDKLLHGKGVEKDENLAMEWFGHAAAQGHAHSSYNLAIGHLKGFKTKLDPGDAHDLIKHAADHGFHLAKDVLLHVCKHGGCTD